MTKEYLNECLLLVPKSGNIYWRRRPVHHFKRTKDQGTFNQRFAGLRAGTLKDGKYLRIRIAGKEYNVKSLVKQLHVYAKSGHQSVS